MNPYMQAYYQAQCQKLKMLEKEKQMLEQTLAGKLLMPWLYLRPFWRKLRTGRHLKKRGIEHHG